MFLVYAPFGFSLHTAPPAYRASHSVEWGFAVFSSHAAYNESITVRRPAPRDHPSHFPDTACPERRNLHHFHPRMYDFRGTPNSNREASGGLLAFLEGYRPGWKDSMGVQMDHLAAGDQSAPLRAASEIFLGTVCGFLAGNHIFRSQGAAG